MLGLMAVAVAACGRKPDTETGSAAAASAAAAPSAFAAPSAPAPSAEVLVPDAEGEELTALDPCLVGSWAALDVSMKTNSLGAEGGAKTALTIAPSGAAVVDFAPMSEVRVTTLSFGFDFRYHGKSKATLTTPRRGTLAAEKPDYSRLRVTANAKLDQAGTVPILKDKPVMELANAMSAFAAARAAPAPSAGVGPLQSASGPSEIDASPVFSSTGYSCGDSALSLRSKNREVTWRFVKVNPQR